MEVLESVFESNKTYWFPKHTSITHPTADPRRALWTHIRATNSPHKHITHQIQKKNAKHLQHTLQIGQLSQNNYTRRAALTSKQCLLFIFKLFTHTVRVSFHCSVIKVHNTTTCCLAYFIDFLLSIIIIQYVCKFIFIVVVIVTSIYMDFEAYINASRTLNVGFCSQNQAKQLRKTFISFLLSYFLLLLIDFP